MLYAGEPLARGYWLGNRFIRPALPNVPRGLMSQPTPPSVQQPSVLEQQIGEANDNGGSGSNTVGGAPTSTAAAPGGFSSSGQANRASSPSVSSGPSYATVGSLLGTTASLALGVPGLGSVTSALGGYQDAKSLNADLAAIGHSDKSVSPGAAAFNSAMFGLPDALGIAGPKTDMAAMGIGLSPRGASELAGFARSDYGLGFTGFDSPEMDAAYGMSMSPVSAAVSPSGLLGFLGNYSPTNDITSLGSPGLGGYGNLGTAHSYGFVDGNLVGNFTGNETSTQSTDGGGAQGGHGGNSNGAGGSDPDGNGNWRVGGYTGNDRDGKLEAIRGTVHEGEYVIRPEATAYYGQGLLKAINERRIPRGMFG